MQFSIHYVVSANAVILLHEAIGLIGKSNCELRIVHVPKICVMLHIHRQTNRKNV